MENKKNNSGALFQNKKREKDTHPHWKGEIMYKNELIYIAGWIRESKAGDKYISISIDDRNNTQSQNNSNYPNKPHEEKKDDFLDLLNM